MINVDKTPSPLRPTGPEAEAPQGPAPGQQRTGAGNLAPHLRVLDERVHATLTLLNFLGPPQLPAPKAKSAGPSAEQVIYEAQQKQMQRKEAEIEADTPSLKSVDLKPVKDAANHFVGEIGDAISRWTKNNSTEVLNFGVQMLNTVVKAVATGGTSLAVDGPQLGLAALGIASAIAKEAGINLDKVAGDFSSAALQSLGVDKAQADQWGKTIGSMSGAVLELTLAYTSGGTHKIDTSKFGALARDFAAAVGADTATSAMIATTVTGLATVGLAIASGGALASVTSLDGFVKAAQSLASNLATGLSSGNLNLSEIFKDGTAAYAKFQTLLTDFQKDTGITDFWKSAGPLAERLAQSALSTLVGLVAPNPSVQA